MLNEVFAGYDLRMEARPSEGQLACIETSRISVLIELSARELRCVADRIIEQTL
jgi:hypothetical protein